MNNVKSLLKSYIQDNLNIKINSKNSFYDFITSDDTIISKVYKGANINEFINKNNDYNNFQTLLFKLIDDRNLKDSDVYNKVHIDRRLFSKIRSDKTYHPSKETVILLSLALELSEKELDELLNSTSYSLPKNNNYDLIIRFCFINKIYKIKDVNDLLNDYNCKLFSY